MSRILEDYFEHTSQFTPGFQWLLHSTAFVAVIVISRILYQQFANGANPRNVPLPPGPKEKWWYPGPRAPVQYTRMIETYGPVFSFKQGKNIIVIIGRYQAAMDILQKHGSDLADRPQMIAANDFISGGKRLLLTPVGERLRRLRRALHSQLQPSVVPRYLPLQFKNAQTMVLSILRDPSGHIEHAKTFAASLIMTLTYGKTKPSYYSDPEIREITRNGARLGTMTYIGARSHIVDVYPILRHIPWVTSTLRQWHKDELGLFTRQVDAVRKEMEHDSAQPSFTSYLLENQSQFDLSDDELAYLAGSMFGAGSETTASATSFVIMAAAKYPEEQAKVQAELDMVVGQDRTPTPSDEHALPHVVAFYLEAFRWRPTGWGSFAHRATKDIFWNGYVIPSGATVIGNNWGISLDPDVYPDPDRFNPGRWLDDKGQLRDDLTYPTYGFGRRVCPGQHLADNSLFATTAILLWAFNISEDPSAPIDTMGFTDTLNPRPLPFKVNFEPRIRNLETILERA